MLKRTVIPARRIENVVLFFQKQLMENRYYGEYKDKERILFVCNRFFSYEIKISLLDGSCALHASLMRTKKQKGEEVFLYSFHGYN